MASIVLHCPNCQQPYQVSPEMMAKYSGKSITCRKCGQPFSFDAAMDTAAKNAGVAEEPTAEAPAAVEMPAAPTSVYSGPAANFPTGASTYSAAPVAPVGYAAGTTARPQVSDFLAFRAMLTPVFIQIVFWVLVGIAVLGAVVEFFVSLIGLFNGGGLYSLGGMLFALVSLIVAVFLIRIYCEVLIVIFRIYDTLRDIKESLDRRA